MSGAGFGLNRGHRGATPRARGCSRSGDRRRAARHEHYRSAKHEPSHLRFLRNVLPQPYGYTRNALANERDTALRRQSRLWIRTSGAGTSPRTRRWRPAVADRRYGAHGYGIGHINKVAREDPATSCEYLFRGHPDFAPGVPSCSPCGLDTAGRGLIEFLFKLWLYIHSAHTGRPPRLKPGKRSSRALSGR